MFANIFNHLLDNNMVNRRVDLQVIFKQLLHRLNLGLPKWEHFINLNYNLSRQNFLELVTWNLFTVFVTLESFNMSNVNNKIIIFYCYDQIFCYYVEHKNLVQFISFQQPYPPPISMTQDSLWTITNECGHNRIITLVEKKLNATTSTWVFTTCFNGQLFKHGLTN